MSGLTQHRHHGGHAHGPGHHHHHDNTYLLSGNKKDAGYRITRLGLYVNVGMAVGKGLGGWAFHSQALVADAFHALTDMVSDLMTLATLSVARRPPTRAFPLGFGKVESLGSLVVSGLLLAGGVVMAQHALGSLVTQFAPEVLEAVGWSTEHAGHGHGHGHGHSHGLIGHAHDHSIPNVNAAWLAGGSIVVKEWLYRKTMKIADERKSSILASNALHHRVDSLASIVALVAIGGVHLIPGATWLDPVGGLLVAIMVIRGGFGNVMATVYELCDRGLDDEMRESVLAAARGADLEPGVEVRDVQGVKAGQSYRVEVELGAPGSWSLDRLRAAEDAVRARVGATVRGARRVRVRFVPAQQAHADFADEFVPPDASPRGSPEPEGKEHAHAHDHDHDHDHHHHDSHDRPTASSTSDATKKER